MKLQILNLCQMKVVKWIVILEKYIIPFEKNICCEHVLLFLIVIVMTISVHSDEKKEDQKFFEMEVVFTIIKQ